jgi:hypothetical protein
MNKMSRDFGVCSPSAMFLAFSKKMSRHEKVTYGTKNIIKSLHLFASYFNMKRLLRTSKIMHHFLLSFVKRTFMLL